MAFPTVRSSSTGNNSNGTAPDYDLPATIESGDLILVIAANDASASLTLPSGFTSVSNQDATQFQVDVFAKVADGTEDSTTVSGTLSASESSNYIVLCIQDWGGTIATDIDINTITTGTGTAPDPAAVTAGWGSADNLYIACNISDYWNRTATAWPTSYTGNQLTSQHSDQFGGTQGVSVCTRELAASSDNPSAFTIGGSGGDSYAAFTIVVEPSAAGASLDTNDDPIAMGAAFSYTVSGFGSTINDVHIERGSFELEATGENDTGATMPGLSHGLVMPSPGSGATLSVSDGTDTDTATVTFNPPSGWTWAVTTTQAGGLTSKDWSNTITLDTNDGFITRDADTFVTHNTDGTSTVTAAGTTLVYSWDATDGTLTEIEITYTDQEIDPNFISSTATVYQPSVSGGAFTAVPAASRQNNRVLGLWLSSQGYTGDFNQKFAKYLEDEGFTEGTLNRKHRDYLDFLGYTGSFQDKINQWRKDS